jgi:tRNA G18 (ribose-2'-O)-methylase SpoU
MKLDAKQLRVTKPTEDQLAKLNRKPLYIVLDNVLDTYNIGSIFRLADAVGAMEVILCGGSETPPNSRIHKAAVGTEEWVKWRYFKTAADFLKDFEGKIIVVEQDERSTKISNFKFSISNSQPVAVVVGHETAGVSQEALNIADVIVEIPMLGINKSLNVHVSAAIVIYWITNLIL